MAVSAPGVKAAAMAERTNYITKEELSKHNQPGDQWICIHGKIYNISNWIKHHPGGAEPLIFLAGQDVTDAFIAYHPRSVWLYLDKFFTGLYLEDYTVSELSRDYRELEAKFSKLGLYEQKGHVILYTLSFVAALFILCVCGVLFSDSFFIHMCCGCLLGLLWMQSGFFGHDSGHSDVMINRKLTQFSQILVGGTLGGLSIEWWKWNHNVHHIAVNCLEFDPDLQHVPFFAVSSKFFYSLTSRFHDRKMDFTSVAKFLISIQHWTFYPVMLIARFNLFFQSLKYLLLSKRKVPRRGQQIFGLFLFWVWFPLLVSCLPNWNERMFFVLACNAVSGIQHVQLCLSHFASYVYVGSPSGNDWFEKQTMGTLNIDCSPWMDWFHGGLQFQVEHHLFPRLPKYQLRKIAPVIKELCKKYNLPYQCPTFWGANVMLWRTLHNAAMQARDFDVDGAKNLVWEAFNTHG